MGLIDNPLRCSSIQNGGDNTIILGGKVASMSGVHGQPYAVHFESTIHFVFGHKSHQTTFFPFCEINLHFHSGIIYVSITLRFEKL